jgi:DNA helicase-2/ATP-dependent DNA helicase PcrA
MTEDELRRLLNPAQFDAATHTEGPLLVFAGAGSGKTRVITYRTAHLVQAKGVAPWKILCVTFTNKAAGEMRERLAHTLGEASSKGLWIATFHATGAKLLRKYHEHVGLTPSFAIYDDGEQKQIVNRVLESLGLDEKLAAKDVLPVIDRAKQDMITPLELAERAETDHDGRIAEVYANYEHRMHAANAVDFGDLLSKVAHLLDTDEFVRTELQRRFQYVMVDEFQDTNAAQYKIVRHLVGPQRNLCVVGDDDQAIYRWRGADVRNIQYFTRDFEDAKVVKLEQNYRSTGTILKAANAVIARLNRREKKTLFTENGEGDKLQVLPCRDEREEAQNIANAIHLSVRRGNSRKEHAIFYRIHAQSRPIEEALAALNIPYVVVGGQRFFERAEIKDVLAYMRLAQNPNDDVSLLRVVNVPARGLGKTSLDRLVQHGLLKDSSLWKLISSGDYPSDLGAAARNRLKDFWTLLCVLRRFAQERPNAPSELCAEILERTGYRAMLLAERSPEAAARLENVQELSGSMQDYEREADEPSLTEYLERVTLDQGERESDGTQSNERVSLMSVHSAKGLEFDHVYLTGMEDGMFPYKGMDIGSDPEEMDEERRLAYVAITRARKRLTLSFTSYRQLFGNTKVHPVSRFLLELPEELLSSPVRRRRVEASDLSSDFARVRAPSGAVKDRGHGITVEYDAEHANGVSQDSSHLDQRLPATGSARLHDDSAGFRKGMRIKHPKFGLGRVELVEPGSEVRLTVYFPSLGSTKRILADFVQPV